MSALADKTCQSTEWWTPPEILEPVRAYFGGQIALDPATCRGNPTKARIRFTPTRCGLSRGWPGVPTFVNPPYGEQLMAWVRKICDAAQSGARIVALLPGQRFETATWQEHLLPSPHLSAIVFIRGRVKFSRPNGERAKSNPYGSMLYAFNVRDLVEFRRLFSPLGHVQPWRVPA